MFGILSVFVGHCFGQHFSQCVFLFLCCVVLQILRSMLYRGSEIMREVGWVIFDEIHYMRDKGKSQIAQLAEVGQVPVCNEGSRNQPIFHWYIHHHYHQPDYNHCRAKVFPIFLPSNSVLCHLWPPYPCKLSNLFHPPNFFYPVLCLPCFGILSVTLNDHWLSCLFFTCPAHAHFS